MAKKPKAKAKKPTKYTATDGVLFLELKAGENGRYTVTSPFVPGLVTEAKTLEQAFKMAHDAVAELKAVSHDKANPVGAKPTQTTNTKKTTKKSGATSRR